MGGQSEQISLVPDQCESVHVNTLLIVEGSTETAAAIAIDYCVIGRPACIRCEDMIAALVRECAASTTLIIADADEPGQRGRLGLSHGRDCTAHFSGHARAFLQHLVPSGAW